MSRRDFLARLAAVSLLAACGRDDGDGRHARAGGPAPAPTPTTATPTPGRVVALGQGPEADALVSLGVTPVAMSEAFIDTGIYPWTEAALGDARPELLSANAGLPVEQIVALRHDLIVASTYYDFDKDRGDLEAIGPVLGPATTADRETWPQ